MNDISDRIRELRKDYLKLSQSDFGDALGISRDAINNIENNRLKRPEQKEPIYRLICEKFGVNDAWLRTGEGDMFATPEDDDETAALVYELLGPEKNELYDIILEIIRSYKELSPGSQQVIREYAGKIVQNIKKKSGD